MTTETGIPRSRRALLAAGAAAGVATVASALGRPSPASAATGVFVSDASATAAVYAHNTAASGVPAHGVLGLSDSTGGYGVGGSTTAATGTTYGVHGASNSTSGFGVYGYSPGVGVHGQSDQSYGLVGASYATGTAAVLGRSDGNSTGVIGRSGTGDPASPPKTGVYGYAAQDATSIGVKGETVDGFGVVGTSATQVGVHGSTSSGYGVYGLSTSNLGVYGYSSSHVAVQGTSGATSLPAIRGIAAGDAAGVQGYSGAAAVPGAATKTGVYGYADQDITAIGVRGQSGVGLGVHGGSGSGDGVTGSSSSAIGVVGVTDGSTKPAILGTAAGGNTGVQGFSGGFGSQPASLAKTGVFGYAAQDGTAIGVSGQTLSGRGVLGVAASGTGVRGDSTSGMGVRGQSTSGTAGYFATTSPTVGIALRVDGRVRFTNCVGSATVLLGTKTILVTPGIDVTTASIVTATLMGSAGGTTTVHRVAVNATANTFTIYLTANSTANVKVGWHVFG